MRLFLAFQSSSLLLPCSFNWNPRCLPAIPSTLGMALLPLLFLLACTQHLAGQEARPGLKTIHLDQQAPPPDWALWERHLLEFLHPAALEFLARYTNPDGTLIWREEWPGMDGSDDGYESFYNFPLYAALGGPMEIDSLARHLWEGVTRQFTTYGQVHDEFDAGYDWMHHGESYTYLYFFGLTDPNNETFKKTIAKICRFVHGPGTRQL